MTQLLSCAVHIHSLSRLNIVNLPIPFATAVLPHILETDRVRLTPAKDPNTITPSQASSTEELTSTNPPKHGETSQVLSLQIYYIVLDNVLGKWHAIVSSAFHILTLDIYFTYCVCLLDPWRGKLQSKS